MKHFKWLENIFRLGHLLLIAITLLAYAAPFISPNSLWFLAILGLGYPLLLIANIAFLLFWIMVKNRLWIVLSIACIMLGWNYLNAIIGINFSSNPPSTSHQLTVLSYNVRYFKVINHTLQERLERADKVLSIPEIKSVDIFCGQELAYPAFSKQLDKKLAPVTQSPNHYASSGNGLLITSKYPIINKGEVKSPQQKTGNCLFADIQINNNTIFRVYNLYLSSNRVSGTTEQMKIDPDEIKTKGFWQNVKNIVKSYRNASKIRATQANTIANHIKGSPYPVIVCGDFNDPPVSYAYQQLIADLQDTFCQKGRGLGTTYAGNIPLLRIDYIFADNRLEVLNYKRLPERYSDHFPIVAELGY